MPIVSPERVAGSPLPALLDAILREPRFAALAPYRDVLLELMRLESGFRHNVVAAQNTQSHPVVKELQARGVPVVHYRRIRGPQGISVGLFQLNLLGMPRESQAELERIVQEVTRNPGWRLQRNDPASLLTAAQFLADPKVNMRVALAHIAAEMGRGRTLKEALRPWEASGRALDKFPALAKQRIRPTTQPAPEAGEAVAPQPEGEQQPAQAEADAIEQQIQELMKLGFSREEAMALLRRSYLASLGLTSTAADPLELLSTGLDWLTGLSTRRQAALAASAQAYGDATQLLNLLLRRAAPGGAIPGLEPGSSVEFFSRLAGLGPMPPVQTRTIDLGPMFEAAALLRPEADPYLKILAAAAEKMGADIPTLWQQARGELEEELQSPEVPEETKQRLRDIQIGMFEGLENVPGGIDSLLRAIGVVR